MLLWKQKQLYVGFKRVACIINTFIVSFDLPTSPTYRVPLVCPERYVCICYSKHALFLLCICRVYVANSARGTSRTASTDRTRGTKPIYQENNLDCRHIYILQSNASSGAPPRSKSARGSVHNIDHGIRTSPKLLHKYF